MFWFCVCFALARHLPPNPFIGYVPPAGLGGQARIYYCGVLLIRGAPFGAGVGAIFGKTGLGALAGIPAGFVLGILISDPHYN
ncbi:MAG: hypothetical protein U0836_16180 [Pirellulales bacterium]